MHVSPEVAIMTPSGPQTMLAEPVATLAGPTFRQKPSSAPRKLRFGSLPPS